MLPLYKPGGHVLTWNWGQARKGDVVVFRQEGKYFIKRIDKFVDPSTRRLVQGKHYNKVYNYIYVSGDNKKMSSKVGPIYEAQIIGRVILKF